jgi:glycosyltransferase involved in cell wall biosynthesis
LQVSEHIPLKLLYIHQYFITPDQPGGTRSYWFAKKAVEQGHQVTVIAGRNSQRKLVCRENVEGIDVIYIRNPYHNKMGYLRRIQSFVVFMLLSAYYGLREKKVDLVFATSTPLSVGIPAVVIKRLKRKRFIFEVRDLWPEAPIQLGIVKNRVLINLLRQSEKLIYRSASHIIALSPGIKEEIVRQGVKDGSVSMIPNMAKKTKFFPRPPDHDLALQLGIDLECFNAVHFGAMGFANGLDYVIDAAAILKSRVVHDVHFLFAGEGRMENSLHERCRQEGLDNVKFIGAHAMTTISKIVNLCDCSLVIFSDVPVLYTNSPNKLFDSLSAAKPVIVNSNGWTRDIVEEHGCGKFVDPGSPADLAEALLYLKDHPAEVSKMRENCRKLAELVYDESILTSQFLSVIEKFAV